MYYEMLSAGDDKFVQGINRVFPRFRTKRLDAVVAKLNTAQTTKSAQTLRELLDAMQTWRAQDPNEFANRGGTNGVAYRLWMEAKQALHNNFHQNYGGLNPAKPPGCPGTELNNVYVPAGEGFTEICHAFAYRWAIAAGKIAEDHRLGAKAGAGGDFNGNFIAPILYPEGFNALPAARTNGAMQLQQGDIIGMFVLPRQGAPAHITPPLGHSLIAETATIWFSANNAGTFEMGTGRERVNTAGHFAPHRIGNRQVQTGWVGNGNVWMRPDGVEVAVIYRRRP